MILVYLLLSPFIYGLLCWKIINRKILNWVAFSGMCSILLISILLWNGDAFLSCKHVFPIFPPKSRIEFIASWIPNLGISIHLMADNLSQLMIVLSGTLGILIVLSSWEEKVRYRGSFYLNIFWIIGSLIGIFLSSDLLLLFFFWEMISIPTYFLVIYWGNGGIEIISDRVQSANKFFIYSQISGLFMLLSIVCLSWCHYEITKVWTFDFSELLNTQVKGNIQYLILIGFFLSFSIKIPIFPFHDWLPNIHYYSPSNGSVDLLCFLTKTAIYGIIRFVLPLSIDISHQFFSIIDFFGIFGIFYGSWKAFSQNDLKKLVAYSNISHANLVLLTIFNGNTLSYQGSLIFLVSSSLSSAGIFIICGYISRKLRTTSIELIRVNWNRLNFVPSALLFFTLANLGIPGTGNLIGKILIFLGTFQKHEIIATCLIISTLFTSIYSIFLIQNIFYGTNKLSTKHLSSIDISSLEKFVLCYISFLILLIGIFPNIITDFFTS